MVSQLTLSRKRCMQAVCGRPHPTPEIRPRPAVPPPRPGPPPREREELEDAGRRAALAARRLPKSASAARRPRLPVWLTVHIPKGASSQIQMLDVVYIYRAAPDPGSLLA
jgi:hypothetical protein